jgi:hypothetical protein
MAEVSMSGTGSRVPSRVKYQGVTYAICRACFDVIGSRRAEAILLAAEKIHHCTAWVLKRVKKMAPEFRRKTFDDDSVKYESLCKNCSHKVFAYTAAVLDEKERQHKCQNQQWVDSRLAHRPVRRTESLPSRRT